MPHEEECQSCVKCGGEVEEDFLLTETELSEGCAPWCSRCLALEVRDVLEELGHPIVVDEEDGRVYFPTGIQN